MYLLVYQSHAAPCSTNSQEDEVTRMGGTGGCILGGSEDDLCLPERSMEPGFHAGELWRTPLWPVSCPIEIRGTTRKTLDTQTEMESLASFPTHPWRGGCFCFWRRRQSSGPFLFLSGGSAPGLNYIRVRENTALCHNVNRVMSKTGKRLNSAPNKRQTYLKSRLVNYIMYTYIVYHAATARQYTVNNLQTMDIRSIHN